MAIRVVAQVRVKSGKKDELIEKVYTELIEETRKEKGLVFYDLHVLVDNPDVIAMIETWETMADLEAHLNSDHFNRLAPLAAPYCSEPTRLEIYEQIL